MSIFKNTVLCAAFLCACILAVNTAETYADTTSTTQTTTQKSWNNTSIDSVKANIQNYNTALTKQANIDYNRLFNTSTLHKTQKERYDKYTSDYTTSLKVAKESMNFYMDDLNDVAASKDDAETKAKAAEDIKARARTDYQEAISATQTYLANCAYVMPTLSYQKFIKAFESNYALGELDTKRFSTMK